MENATNNTADILTAIAAFLALGISLLSIFLNRRKLVTTAISANRIEWIGTVRELIYNFLVAYKNGNLDEMILIYSHIVLFCNRRGSTYKNFIAAMKRCINNSPYDDKYYWDVVECGQDVLDASWRRMKRESGVTYNKELANAKKNKKEPVHRSEWEANIKKP